MWDLLNKAVPEILTSPPYPTTVHPEQPQPMPSTGYTTQCAAPYQHEYAWQRASHHSWNLGEDQGTHAKPADASTTDKRSSTCHSLLWTIQSL